ncbi:hypothetical protein V8C86DRAFT_239702 [Haematococcus lacustris]
MVDACRPMLVAEAASKLVAVLARGQKQATRSVQRPLFSGMWKHREPRGLWLRKAGTTMMTMTWVQATGLASPSPARPMLVAEAASKLVAVLARGQKQATRCWCRQPCPLITLSCLSTSMLQRPVAEESRDDNDDDDMGAGDGAGKSKPRTTHARGRSSQQAGGGFGKGSKASNKRPVAEESRDDNDDDDMGAGDGAGKSKPRTTHARCPPRGPSRDDDMGAGGGASTS